MMDVDCWTRGFLWGMGVVAVGLVVLTSVGGALLYMWTEGTGAD